MASEASNLLNKRLLHFLSNRLDWTKLNPIQEKAIPEIIDGNDTLVIAPTASGKTEAVLIPVFSELLDNNFDPVSVLYVSPLKALINDMCDRIDLWGNHFDVTTTKWHGDVEKNVKDKFLKNPTDFLLITPESLEVIFMNKSERDKENIFKNIKYVIVDEIHYFAESDRGIQLNSLLNRIDNYTDTKPTRIGLSATVGNPNDVASWLNHENLAKIVKTEANRKFQYKVWNGAMDDIIERLEKYEDKKVLIFANSRATAEIYFEAMKKKGFENLFIHHSSIGKSSRENSEKRFKEEKYGFMISTSTLELGIDIGNIDIVVQLNPPNNISSFLQRIGRGGRRSKLQRSIIACGDTQALVTLAELILIKENNIEKIKIPTNSKDLLFHQILSCIFEKGTIHYKEIYNNLSTCYVFSDISKKDYIKIIENMVEKDFISNNNGLLSLGYTFEKKFGKRNFMDYYAVFCPTFEYVVKNGRKEVGTVDASFALTLKPNMKFILGGKYWRVINIDSKKFRISVEEEHYKIKVPKWVGNGLSNSFLITRKIYDILLGNFDIKFLNNFDDSLKEIINKSVIKAKENKFTEGIIPVEFDSKENTVYIYTFAGRNANNFLSILFEYYYDITDVNNTDFAVNIKTDENISLSDVEQILYNIKETLAEDDFKIFMRDKAKIFRKNKFVGYLPIDDEIEIKLTTLFDLNNLVKFIDENTLVEVYNTGFKNWFTSKD